MIFDSAKLGSFIHPDRIQITDMCTIFTDSEMPCNQPADKVITLSNVNDGYGQDA
jgi:hypothetical protein